MLNSEPMAADNRLSSKDLRGHRDSLHQPVFVIVSPDHIGCSLCDLTPDVPSSFAHFGVHIPVCFA